MINIDNLSKKKPKQRQRRRVSFSSSVDHFHMEERYLLTNWRERVAAILASKVCRNVFFVSKKTNEQLSI